MANPAQPTPKYSKEELVAKLKQGASVWNEWRRELPQDETLDLSGADLANLDLRGADLHSTELRDAILRNADLNDLKGGLLYSDLAGTDLTRAKLPDSLSKLYEKLESIADVASSVRNLLLVVLTGCLYCLLTVAATKDVDLITNRASSSLPFIQTTIPIVGFFAAAPIILGGVYYYFHFYLQKFWEELASLPAIFPDGRPLDLRVDQTIFSVFVRAYFPRLNRNRPFLSKFQHWSSSFLAWWTVPLTLLFIWARYLPRHDPFGTLLLSLCMSLAIISPIQLQRLARETLRGNRRTAFNWKEMHKHRRFYTDVLWVMLVVAAINAIAFGAIYGTPQNWLVRTMSRLGYSPFANLRDADVSIKPPNWTGKNEQELNQVKGADLTSRDLRYASASRTFLAKAQLQNSDLHGAYLLSSDLIRANLGQADLTQAHLEGSNLRDANLDGADIRYADFQNAAVSKDTVVYSKNWQLAFYDRETLKQLNLPPDHNEALRAYQVSKSQEPFADAWIKKWRENQSNPHANPK